MESPSLILFVNKFMRSKDSRRLNGWGRGGAFLFFSSHEDILRHYSRQLDQQENY